MNVMENTNEWINVNDESTWPTENGLYEVEIAGDSESMDGHTLYEYPDYKTTMKIFVEHEDGEKTISGFGEHDEEWYMAQKYRKIPNEIYTAPDIQETPEDPEPFEQMS